MFETAIVEGDGKWRESVIPWVVFLCWCCSSPL
jgi:hypothetical protein